jgi:hypothetical protein
VGENAAASDATPKIALPSSSSRLKPILSPSAHRQHHTGHH